MESMTGYGRATARLDGREMTIEMKAVNHRFLDLAFRAPKNLSFLEEPLRSLIQKNGVGRGHLEIFITYVNQREDAKTVTVDETALMAFNQAIASQHKLLEDYKRISAAEALQMSGALTLRQADEDSDAVTKLALEAAGEAVQALLAMRRTEGENLKQDLLSNLKALSELRDKIALRAPEVPKEYRKRLENRLKEWAVSDIDPQRVAQEVAILADRCAIDEELSRLISHIDQFASTAETAAEAGKKLDFLLQEMNREVNTIGSKASDAEIAQNVVAAKCIVEKLREQVQNVV